eukprot:gene3312-32907_t
MSDNGESDVAFPQGSDQDSGEEEDVDDAEPEVSRADIEKKKKAAVPSLFSPNQMARHSIMIQGHTNVREYENVIGAAAKKAKVKAHTDAVRVEDHIKLQHMGTLMESWRDKGDSKNYSDS